MIIDNNFLNKKEQEDFLKLAISPSLQWTMNLESVSPYKDDPILVVTDKTKETTQFNHKLRFNDKILSPYYDSIINNVFMRFINKHNIPCHVIYRAKLNLVTCLDEDVYQTPHVDMEEPHKVFLYYINDSDGDTIFFNEFFNGTKQESLTFGQSFTPEMGKGIVFDGHQYHAPTAPKKTPFRVVLNVDFN